MAGKEVFAAIDVGSYEVGLKIYELSTGKGMRELDHVVHRIDLGSETYATGHISKAHVRELSRILTEFNDILKSYGVKNYRAYATSALRETKDSDVVLNLLETETGLKINILSNSEQRFLDYKSVAMHGEKFANIIEKPTVFVDIGGGSLQLSVFDKDKLVVTQNLRLGVLRTQQILTKIDAPPSRYTEIISEMTAVHIADFKKMYLEEKNIRNLIIVDDYLSPFLCRNRIGSLENGYASAKDYRAFLAEMTKRPRPEIAAQLNIPLERIPLVSISAKIIDCIARELDADTLWAPGVTLSDGIAYDYAEQKKYLAVTHDFDRDIVAAAKTMAGRYMGSRKNIDTLVKTSLEIFDVMKKQHALGTRERLFLQIAALLHDCGRFISLENIAESAYHIIRTTEMIGLSHRERKIVATIVWMTHFREEGQSDADNHRASLSPADRLLVSKLSAILRVADSVCRTGREEHKALKIKLKGRELLFMTDPTADYVLEKGVLTERKELFESVYGITPVIRAKVERSK